MPMEPRVTEADAARTMAELEPAWSGDRAVVEADRCLYCFDAPCIHACPTGIDVPTFIGQIRTGDRSGSGRTILRANILGASCARVCPTEVLCEGACVLNDLGREPVRIGRLQRFATDAVGKEVGLSFEGPKPAGGGRVAVIGGGPAGLACAAELARRGHRTVVFEKQPEAGGLNRYGIAYYKLRPEVCRTEVDRIRALGVEIRVGAEIGRDVAPESLRQDYDAVFLAPGLGATRRLGVPGEDLSGVCEALSFIEQVRTRPLHRIPVGRRVAVIGGGNTAIDAATQAKRLGAEEVVLVVRRGESDMPAFRYEVDLARQDGIQFRFGRAIREILGNDSGEVVAVRWAETGVDASEAVRDLDDTTTQEPFDMVIKALGQESLGDRIRGWFPEVPLAPDGTIRRDPATGATGIAGLYAGGDACNGGAEVVDAVAEGLRAAWSIHYDLTGEEVGPPPQTSRQGIDGGPVGAGIRGAVRIPEEGRPGPHG